MRRDAVGITGQLQQLVEYRTAKPRVVQEVAQNVETDQSRRAGFVRESDVASIQPLELALEGVGLNFREQDPFLLTLFPVSPHSSLKKFGRECSDAGVERELFVLVANNDNKSLAHVEPTRVLGKNKCELGAHILLPLQRWLGHGEQNAVALRRYEAWAALQFVLSSFAKVIVNDLLEQKGVENLGFVFVGCVLKTTRCK
jgi:hypothetical protein